MCGIAGWVDFGRNMSKQVGIVQKMIHSMQNRGPDEIGFYSCEHVVLGHCRLVVIDPAGGMQPMSKKKGEWEYIITYNGELYNTGELRKVLEKRGYIFESRNSDTEVLLTAYMEWGNECLNKLNGIYAFAIWDQEKQHLFMARDRLGVKPLFFSQRGTMLLFASEPKALLSHPEMHAEIDMNGLTEILFLGPSRTPGYGIFKGISELRPGHFLEYDQRGVRIQRYWQLKSQTHKEDLHSTADHLRFLLEDTVSRQLVADVPICTFLSGGLDSSALSALAVKELKSESSQDRLTTFSVDYLEESSYYHSNHFETSYDAPWAERVSRHLGTRHTPVWLDPEELADALSLALDASDYPGMTDIDSSLYLFCREVRKEATVALSGECADELLGGYPWFQNPFAITNSFPWIRMVEERSRFLSSDLVNRLSIPEYLNDRYTEAIGEVPVLSGESDMEIAIRRLFYLNITRFMPALLDRKDRMSMAWGLEVRVPFSDHRLVEYIWNIPWEMKNYGNMSKGILRLALEDVLPEDVIRRKKSPYPKSHHPLYKKAVINEMQKVLSNPSSPLLPLINTQAFEQALVSGNAFLERPFFGQLMGDVQFIAYMLQVNRWLEKFQINLCL